MTGRSAATSVGAPLDHGTRLGTELDGLVSPPHHRGGPVVTSAEEDVAAAEAQAARTPDARLRGELSTAARLIRRIDQAVVGFATDLHVP